MMKHQKWLVQFQEWPTQQLPKGSANQPYTMLLLENPKKEYEKFLMLRKMGIGGKEIIFILKSITLYNIDSNI